MDIPYYHAFNKMLLDGYEIEPCKEPPLYDFQNNLVPIQGTISLPVVFGFEPYQVESIVQFYVVHKVSSYNTIHFHQPHKDVPNSSWGWRGLYQLRSFILIPIRCF